MAIDNIQNREVASSVRDKLNQTIGICNDLDDRVEVLEGLTGEVASHNAATDVHRAYVKQNVLPDSVCDVLGIDRVESEPKDAFMVTGAIPDGYGAVAVRFHATVTGLQTGHIVTSGTKQSISNSAGIAMLVLAVGLQTVQILPALDANLTGSGSCNINIRSGETVCVDVDITAKSITQMDITSSRLFSLSGRVATFDLFGVGGGGSGGIAFVNGTQNQIRPVASGGGGGYTSTVFDIINLAQIYTAQVALGGTSVSLTASSGGSWVDGNAGGNTSVKQNDIVILDAQGGKNGNGYASSTGYNYQTINGADGGSGSSAVTTNYSRFNTLTGGSDGSSGGSVPSEASSPAASGGIGQGTTTKAFGENNGTAYSPAGGSAHGNINATYIGNVGVGASIAVGSTGTSAVAVKSTVPGAGGGAAVIGRSSTTTVTVKSAAGANGILIVRWEYA